MTAARRRTAPDRAGELARAIAGAVLLEPETAPAVLAILRAGDLPPGVDEVVDTVARRARLGLAATLADVASDLRDRGRLAAVGGEMGIAQLFDEVATSAYAVQHARELRLLQRDARRRYLHGKLSSDPDDAEARAELGTIEAEAIEGRPGPELASVALMGETLRALRYREKPDSPLPGLLDPEPHLHVLLGRPKSGKTTFALALARAWASGSAPWPGAAPMPGTCALVVSREQVATRLDATLRRLARHAGEPEAWTDRLAIVARDPALPPESRRLLTLDADGLDLLRGVLDGAREAGEPVGLLVLDSLSRLKPPEIEERDNDGVSRWLDALEEIATSRGSYVLLIHHVGHTPDAGRAEARSAGRGASAIAAVAQVVLLLDRMREDPRLRRIEVDGNAVMPGEHVFQVSKPTDDPGAIHYFRPFDPLDSYSPHDLLPPEGASITRLAWGVSGKDPEQGARPPGSAMRRAGDLAGRWERAGLVDVTDGPRGARVVRLRPGIRRPEDG